MKTGPALGASGPHLLRDAVAYGLTDIGPVRSNNEDNFLIDDGLDLLAVADGMGGHTAGAFASAAALDALRECLAAGMAAPAPPLDLLAADPDATLADPTMPALALLHDAVAYANRRLFQHNQAREQADGTGMGTTLTGCWRPLAGGPLLVFHVGDSRLYRYRGGELTLLTRDQTWYQQALESGKVDDLPARNMLLQAVGPAPHVKPEIRLQAVQAGDVLMLCSDGLHGSVPYRDLVDVLHATSAQTLETDCCRLIALAYDYGARDNVTVLLALCRA